MPHSVLPFDDGPWAAKIEGFRCYLKDRRAELTKGEVCLPPEESPVIQRRGKRWKAVYLREDGNHRESVPPNPSKRRFRQPLWADDETGHRAIRGQLAQSE